MTRAASAMVLPLWARTLRIDAGDMGPHAALELEKVEVPPWTFGAVVGAQGSAGGWVGELAAREVVEGDVQPPEFHVEADIAAPHGVPAKPRATANPFLGSMAA